ncbi:MAG TPA: alpha/beta hydrolase [Azospirillaceae bacterium]|nr:alpha/beta hydrolase [Azospirillaceae bacterium]
MDSRSLTVTDHRIDGHARPVELRLYRPAGPVRAAVLYLHGGGFTGGSLDEADGGARALALGAGVPVLSVAYSLAPHHPFPAAPHDALGAAGWLKSSLGGKALRLGVAGVEAGGHVAVSVTMIARDQGCTGIAAQALLGPLLDPSLTCANAARDAAAVRNVARCAEGYRAYLPDPSLRLHPYAAPLDCRRLAGLPPALVITGIDPLTRDEAERYASALSCAGITVERLGLDVPAPSLPTHGPALDALAAFFRRHLTGSKQRA